MPYKTSTVFCIPLTVMTKAVSVSTPNRQRAKVFLLKGYRTHKHSHAVPCINK